MANQYAFQNAYQGTSPSYTDPGIANVRLGTSYVFANQTKTGNVRVPVASDVKVGVVFESLDSQTGTYDGSDRWTDPGQNNVTLGVTYKANSTTTNRTGTVRLPAVSDVRSLVQYGPNDSLVGTFGDGTPPVFSGISGLTALTSGALQASWSAASDPDTPIIYQVYIQANTATGLFSTTPLATLGTSLKIYSLSNGSDLVAGTTYYVGVRARDASGNIETNTVSLSAVSEGVTDGQVAYDSHGTFSISSGNQLEGTLWATADEEAISTLLGAANYTVYDSSGAAVPGLSESGITADANGFFQITPVAATNLQDLNHYVVKIGIIVDGQERVAYRGLTVVG